MKFNYFSVFFLAFIAFLLLPTISCNNNKIEGKGSRVQKIETVRQSVVSFTLRNKNEDKPETLNYGTGFFVDENYIVTADHVAKELIEEQKVQGGEKSIEIVVKKSSFSDKSEFAIPVSLIKTDEENDISIYRFNPEDIKSQWQNFVVQPLLLEDNLPDIGEEILLTGYFGKYTYPFSSVGTVSMITEAKFKIEETIFNQAIFSDLTTIPGHSGGPLYSLQTHKVIGIATRVLNPNKDRARISIAANSLHIRKLLNKVQKKDSNDLDKTQN